MILLNHYFTCQQQNRRKFFPRIIAGNFHSKNSIRLQIVKNCSDIITERSRGPQIFVKCGVGNTKPSNDYFFNCLNIKARWKLLNGFNNTASFLFDFQVLMADHWLMEHKGWATFDKNKSCRALSTKTIYVCVPNDFEFVAAVCIEVFNLKQEAQVTLYFLKITEDGQLRVWECKIHFWN